jgi:5'-3' exonuclease
VNRLEKQIATVNEDIVIACHHEPRFCGFCYIRAPYEADAQLVYMAREQIIDVVYSEDSDLIIHGVDHVIFGLNNLWSGWCYSATQDALAQFERIDEDNPLLQTVRQF